MPGPCKVCGLEGSPLVKTRKGEWTFKCASHFESTDTYNAKPGASGPEGRPEGAR